MTKLAIRRSVIGTVYSWPIDAENKLELVMKHGESPFLAIGFIVNGEWFYQNLMWSCRAARHQWFKPMIAMYREIRRQNLTDYSLRYIAWSNKRLKNGGYRVGTASHRSFVEIGIRMAQTREREKRQIEAVRSKLLELSHEQGFTFHAKNGNSWVIGDMGGPLGRTCTVVAVEAFERFIRLTKIQGPLVRSIAANPVEHLSMPRGQEPVVLRIDPPEPLALANMMGDSINEMFASAEIANVS